MSRTWIDVNPMRIDDGMIQRGAEVLYRDYASEYVADHLSWEDFGDQAIEVINAALIGTRWEDR